MFCAGDFAMLLKAGMPWKQALCYNLLSSVLALLGTGAGILLGTVSNHLTSWLFSATAGIDLYVALVVMAPELSTRHHPRQNWAGILLQTTGATIPAASKIQMNSTEGSD